MKTKSKEQSPCVHNGFSLISNQKLLALYSTMLKCRMIEERIRILIKQNRFTGNGYAALGQEATAAGVAIDLLPEDTASAFPGDLIPLFIKGLPLEKLFARLFSASRPSTTIAAQLHIATGAALANKASKNKKIAVVFCSRECTSHSSWQEALNSAGVHALPILFVSRSTLPAPAASFDPQTKATRMRLKTKACSFPTITVDGNDAVAVYRAACEAIAHARMGDGPTLIECLCWKDGDPTLNDDPLLSMEKYLMRKGLFKEEFKRKIAAEFSRDLDAASLARPE
ncbi:MAG: thiamine pyrophosphate-dependent enzyme [Terracidiphilus sp.]|jgi:TPP-dependent pyruvate/acetoin dehydrogenase alpha subunit